MWSGKRKVAFYAASTAGYPSMMVVVIRFLSACYKRAVKVEYGSDDAVRFSRIAD
jgi:hypothetical protein